MGNVGADGTWYADTGPADIPYLLARHFLRVTDVYVLEGYDVVRVEYEIKPPVEPSFDIHADNGLPSDLGMSERWWVTASDDLGTKYEDWGGAAGLAPSGEETAGEFDFYPAPPATSTWLDIIFHTDRWSETAPQQYTLRIHSPLPSLPFEDYVRRHTGGEG